MNWLNLVFHIGEDKFLESTRLKVTLNNASYCFQQIGDRCLIVVPPITEVMNRTALPPPFQYLACGKQDSGSHPWIFANLSEQYSRQINSLILPLFLRYGVRRLAPVISHVRSLTGIWISFAHIIPNILNIQKRPLPLHPNWFYYVSDVPYELLNLILWQNYF